MPDHERWEVDLQPTAAIDAAAEGQAKQLIRDVLDAALVLNTISISGDVVTDAAVDEVFTVLADEKPVTIRRAAALHRGAPFWWTNAYTAEIVVARTIESNPGCTWQQLYEALPEMNPFDVLEAAKRLIGLELVREQHVSLTSSRLWPEQLST